MEENKFNKAKILQEELEKLSYLLGKLLECFDGTKIAIKSEIDGNARVTMICWNYGTCGETERELVNVVKNAVTEFVSNKLDSKKAEFDAL